MIEHRKLYINGQWTTPASAEMLDVFFPGDRGDRRPGPSRHTRRQSMRRRCGACRVRLRWLVEAHVQERAKYVAAIRDGRSLATTDHQSDRRRGGSTIKAWARSTWR